MEQSISGLALSDGIAMGTAVVFRPEYNVKRYRVADRLAEVDRFRQAVLNAKADLGDLIETAITRLSAQEVEILSVQELLLEDPLVTDEILEEIGQTGFNAEAVVWDVMQRWIQEFTEMEDPYMRGRAIDLIDVRDRLLRMLEGAFHTAPGFGKGSILVMEELPPTIVGDPNLENIGGVVTAKGNETSHGSILARSIGIPLVSGMGDKMAGILPGDFLIVDGTNGQVIINPSPETIERYREQLARRQEQERELLTWRDKQAITQDQYKISVGANIGGLADTKRARKFGADEIGLFRTEVLFMSYGHWPSEEEQFDWYKRILLEMEGRPVIFRVLDIGGDKPLPYFPIEEQNPFLGYRGVRVLFDQIRLFREQLRALYRASRFGPVRIMFPMIHSVEEWKSIQVICEDVRAETGVEPVDLGLMVETPAAALLIDYFVEHVQFISIGTNDLTQYTLAVDRQNDRVKDLYDPLHPAVLRLIRKVAQSAAKKNVWVGVCGELAGDETMLPFWIGLGVNELSVNPNRVLSIKKRISDLSRSEAQQLVANLDNAMTREDVNRILFGKSI
ncbi:phosphoenolpyruvate--protein phosphotransferase [Effusibacillus lacus]|uniref:Phosphoenolpyruvate-protein phosphotransferase n=1 Tax=Effusibacillus lacus TaxID=1348429 RepID=A0A292YKM6_9BACL|nr:phosphoenolpyruvate--protein phosphotransferase [Effusibacillus lacus]